MAWKGSTRDRGDGQLERRCGDKRHHGARWLPLTLVHFHETRYGFLHRCRVCQKRYARERYRALHPLAKVRTAAARVTRRAACELDRITLGWGR